MNFRSFTALLLLTFGFTAAFAQRDTVSLNTIVSKTSKQIATYPFEKVYLHLDKPYYAAGDTIWFKAYVTMDQHTPTLVSTIVYVDIANEQDSIAKILRLPVANGVASGSMPLPPAEFRQGNYHLRAYTAYMRNYEPEYFFNKNVVIGNAVDNTVTTNIAFSSATSTPGTSKITAAVTYKGEEANQLANKKLSWTVVSNGEEIAKGKGTTDANGLANLEINGNAAALKAGTLITVVDMGNRTTVTRSFPLKLAASGYDIQFFPEGGELVSGIRSKVAFKAIDSKGLGSAVKGEVTDNTGAVTATFTSQHLGMGSFLIIPEDGKTYKINVTFADGSKKAFDLPRVKGSGISLSVYNSKSDSLLIKLSANNTYYQANQGKQYYLIAQSGGAVFFAAQTALTTPIYSAAIAKSKFPTGIVQLTLLTDRGVALSERIVFIQHNDALNLNIASAAKSYTTRQKVRLNITAKNKTAPVAGNFSIAVVDETKVPSDENAETSILSNLLLTSDLKGYIEKPNYYFISKDADAAENLDVLMLTQGYRRVSYRNIIANKAPQIAVAPEQNGIELTGVLRNNTGMTISKGSLKLQIPAKNFYAETMTDMVGNYRFANLNFPDSAKVVITGRGNVSSRNLVVTANNESYQNSSKNNMAVEEVLNIDSTYKDYLANSKRLYNNQHILKEVVVKSTVIKAAGHTQFPVFAGLSPQADQILQGSIFKGCNNLYTCIQSVILGTTVEDNKLYLMRNFNSGDKRNMQIFLNNLPVDLTSLNSVSPAEVETVEVFKNAGLSGIDAMYGTAGIVVVTTKKKEKGTKMTFAQLQELIPPPNILTIMPLGYAKTKEFYSPKYDVLKTGNLGGDLRTTIYWNPKVITDKATGATFVEYYNADGRGTYRATIEGFDAEGNLGRYVYRYTVK